MEIIQHKCILSYDVHKDERNHEKGTHADHHAQQTGEKTCIGPCHHLAYFACSSKACHSNEDEHNQQNTIIYQAVQGRVRWNKIVDEVVPNMDDTKHYPKKYALFDPGVFHVLTPFQYCELLSQNASHFIAHNIEPKARTCLFIKLYHIGVVIFKSLYHLRAKCTPIPLRVEFQEKSIKPRGFFFLMWSTHRLTCTDRPGMSCRFCIKKTASR